MSDYATNKVLEFFIDVLAEAERSAGAEVNVIPVVVEEDLARLVPLLVEVCRFAGHPLRIAEEVVDGLPWADPGVEPDVVMAPKIEAISLDPAGTGTPTALVVNRDASTLTVRIGSHGVPTNPGDRNQLGFFTAVLDPELRRHAVAVVAYDETALSDDSKQRVWDFVLSDLQSLGPACKTVVVIVGCASIDYDRHCREGAGARWAFQDGAVRWRQRSQTDLSRIARLAADDDPVVLMLGAGVSMSSNLPLGDALRNRALARFVPDLADVGSSFEVQANEFFHQVASTGRLMKTEEDLSAQQFIETLTLERVLREEARTRGSGETLPTLSEFDELQKACLDRPGGSVRDLRALLHLRRRLVLLTVNFDQMIEHGATVLTPSEIDELDTRAPVPADPPAVRLFVTSDDFKAFPAYYAQYREHGGAVPLVKLHGTIDRPATVRANVDVTLPGLDESAADLLRSLIPPEGGSMKWAYVGCSMRDPDITAITQTQAFALRALETWVSPFVDPHVEKWVADIRQPAWRSAQLSEDLHERAITQTSDSFFSHFRVKLGL